jgi:hypothetical protein
VEGKKKKLPASYVFLMGSQLLTEFQLHACMHAHLWQASLVQFSAYHVCWELCCFTRQSHPSTLINGLSGLVAFLCEGSLGKW